MKRSTASVALYLTIVFASGVLVGGFGHRLYSVASVDASTAPTTPEEYRQRYVDEMRSRLHLDEEQVQSLHVILDETRVRFHEVKERYRPEMKEIQDDQVRQIKSILSEEQRLEYDNMREERERRTKREPGC
ncbi:MAG: hypothetical protein ACK5AZ_15530 [Bryobacteraceae bacterium]